MFCVPHGIGVPIPNQGCKKPIKRKRGEEVKKTLAKKKLKSVKSPKTIFLDYIR